MSGSKETLYDKCVWKIKNNPIVVVVILAAAGLTFFLSVDDSVQKIKERLEDEIPISIVQFSLIKNDNSIAPRITNFDYPINQVDNWGNPKKHRIKDILEWDCPEEEVNPSFELTFHNSSNDSFVLAYAQARVEEFTEGGDVGETTVTPPLGVSAEYQLDIWSEEPQALRPPILLKPDQATRIVAHLNNGRWFNSITVLRVKFYFANGAAIEQVATKYFLFECGGYYDPPPEYYEKQPDHIIDNAEVKGTEGIFFSQPLGPVPASTTCRPRPSDIGSQSDRTLAVRL